MNEPKMERIVQVLFTIWLFIVLSEMKADLGNFYTKAADKDLYGFTAMSLPHFE